MNTVKNNCVAFRKLKQEVEKLGKPSKAFKENETKIDDEEEEISQSQETKEIPVLKIQTLYSLDYIYTKY